MDVQEANRSFSQCRVWNCFAWLRFTCGRFAPPVSGVRFGNIAKGNFEVTPSHSHSDACAFESIDHVPPNIPNSLHSTQVYICEDNAAVIQMMNEGMHRVDLDWLFERVHLDHFWSSMSTASLANPLAPLSQCPRRWLKFWQMPNVLIRCGINTPQFWNHFVFWVISWLLINWAILSLGLFKTRGAFLQDCSSQWVRRATSCRSSLRFESFETKWFVRLVQLTMSLQSARSRCSRLLRFCSISEKAGDEHARILDHQKIEHLAYHKYWNHVALWMVTWPWNNWAIVSFIVLKTRGDLLAGMLFVQKAEGNLLQVDTSFQGLGKQRVCRSSRMLIIRLMYGKRRAMNEP